MDPRNIRTSYYNQLGLSNQKLKTSIDELFKKRIIDKEAIKTICKEFSLPSQYRGKIWKIILLNDKFKESWEFCDKQREEQYLDLKKIAMLQRNINKDPYNNDFDDEDFKTSKKKKESTYETLVTVFRVQGFYQTTNSVFSFNSTDNISQLEAIAKLFTNIFNCEHEAFFCFKNFMSLMDQNMYHTQQQHSFLKLEENDEGCYNQISYCLRLLEIKHPKILNHIKILNFHLDSFLYSWFKGRFTSCKFSISDLLKMWDKIVCVTVDYIACFGASILTIIQNYIFEKKESKQVANFLLQLPSIDYDKLIVVAEEYYETLINF
eukprot:TRINITY_DN5393_c2_g2_i1.p1 TRINITY_DN5393_c2_g2~~TRINITY_DN5393_c2_g2_i1.p1  ORF type:complete len:321 (+),score=75.49 TRINITY_DN5393_c2_g2_i1:26-988(+)